MTTPEPATRVGTSEYQRSVPKPGEARPHLPQTKWGLETRYFSPDDERPLSHAMIERSDETDWDGYFRHLAVASLGVKGGSGKTHCAVHLAYEAALQGEWVALVDVDPSRDASQWVVNAGLNTMQGFPERGVPITVFDLNDPELARAAALGDRRLLQAYLQNLLVDFTLVVIDSPANNPQLTQQLARFVDAAIVPAHLGDGDYGHLGTMQQTIEDAVTLRGRDLPHWVLINHAGHGREAVLRRMTQELREVGWPVMPVAVPFQNDYLLAKGRVLRGAAYMDVYAEVREALHRDIDEDHARREDQRREDQLREQREQTGSSA